MGPIWGGMYSIHMYDNVGGFPANNSALFGLVI